MQYKGTYVKDGIAFPPLSSYSKHTSDWLHCDSDASIRSKYKKVFEYICSKLDESSDPAEPESVAVERIIANAVELARTMRNLASGDNSKPTTARGFADKVLGAIEPAISRTTGKRRRCSLSSDGPLAEDAEAAITGSDLVDVVV